MHTTDKGTLVNYEFFIMRIKCLQMAASGDEVGSDTAQGPGSIAVCVIGILL
jgi:hypothetical protein